MKYDKVIVRQIPDQYAETTGLSKYGRSRMPQTIEIVQAAEGPDGRIITGIDEGAWAIVTIEDAEEREKIIAEKKALRESLENATKKNLDAFSPFWHSFTVSIAADQDLILSRQNPYDVIKYHVLVANGYAAPDKSMTGHPHFINAKYYCHVDERANREEVSTQKIRDKARGKLLELAENHDLAVTVGQFLEGDKYKTKMDDNTIYKMLSDYINDVKEPDNLKRFLKAVDANAEDLQFKITIDRAIKKKVIRYHKDGYYQRGNVTIGKTISEVYKNLQLPEYATEFLSIREEIG